MGGPSIHRHPSMDEKHDTSAMNTMQLKWKTYPIPSALFVLPWACNWFIGFTMRTLRAYYGAFSHTLPPYVYPLHWALLLHAMWGEKIKQLAKTRDPLAPPHFQKSGTA